MNPVATGACQTYDSMTLLIDFSLGEVPRKCTQDSREVGVTSLVKTYNWKLEGAGMDQFGECVSQLIQRARLIYSSPAHVFDEFSRIFDAFFGPCLHGNSNPQLSGRNSGGPAALKRCAEKCSTYGVMKNLKVFVTPGRMPGGSSYKRLRRFEVS